MKRILSLLLCAVMAVGCFFAAASAEILYGDVDNSGTVAANDALLALQYAVGKINPAEEDSFAAADVTGDEKVTTSDALYILQYAVGKIKMFDNRLR